MKKIGGLLSILAGLSLSCAVTTNYYKCEDKIKNLLTKDEYYYIMEENEITDRVDIDGDYLPDFIKIKSSRIPFNCKKGEFSNNKYLKNNYIYISLSDEKTYSYSWLGGIPESVESCGYNCLSVNYKMLPNNKMLYNTLFYIKGNEIKMIDKNQEENKLWKTTTF